MKVNLRVKRCDACPQRARWAVTLYGEVWFFCRHHSRKSVRGIARRLLDGAIPHGPWPEEAGLAAV